MKKNACPICSKLDEYIEIENEQSASTFTSASISFTEGKSSVKQQQIEQVCEKCGKSGGVHYIGTEVLSGTLEFFPGLTTELEHWFHCDLCGAEWYDFQYY